VRASPINDRVRKGESDNLEDESGGGWRHEDERESRCERGIRGCWWRGSCGVACEGTGKDAAGDASGGGSGLVVAVVATVTEREGAGADNVEPSPPPPHFSFFRPLSNNIGSGS
jgi:hypothetical protein